MSVAYDEGHEAGLRDALALVQSCLDGTASHQELDVALGDIGRDSPAGTALVAACRGVVALRLRTATKTRLSTLGTTCDNGAWCRCRRCE